MRTFSVIRNKPDFAEVYEQEYSYVYNYIYMQVMHRENTEDLGVPIVVVIVLPKVGVTADRDQDSAAG